MPNIRDFVFGLPSHCNREVKVLQQTHPYDAYMNEHWSRLKILIFLSLHLVPLSFSTCKIWWSFLTLSSTETGQLRHFLVNKCRNAGFQRHSYDRTNICLSGCQFCKAWRSATNWPANIPLLQDPTKLQKVQLIDSCNWYTLEIPEEGIISFFHIVMAGTSKVMHRWLPTQSWRFFRHLR